MGEVSSNNVRYDRIGAGYARTRREDPGLRARISGALGNARSVVNVGAGAGSYEPTDRQVIAIEPSEVMAKQRPPHKTPAIRASADALPLHDASVDAAMAILSLHHWDGIQERGVGELRRVARGPVVIITFDAEVSGAMWLMRDYVPEIAELDRRIFPSPDRIASWLGGASIEVLPIARDTPDWSLGSFWAHPARVLDADARAATSGFSRMNEAVARRVVKNLERDLASGAWDAKNSGIRSLNEYDAGLRLVVSAAS
jgi:SAM-dependent methyltransferase